MSCIKLDHPNLMPGWGCCKCKVYNGDQREECKSCKHPRCDKKLESKEDKSKLN